MKNCHNFKRQVCNPFTPSNTDSEEKIDHLLYILNEDNKYITKQFIEKTLEKYEVKHKIKNLNIFQIAMTHTSYLERDFEKDKTLKNIKERGIIPIVNIKSAIPLQINSYERLEFLGDSVIHLTLAEYLFNRFPEEHEGFLTKLRTKIENGQSLAKLARSLGFCEYVLIGKYIEAMGGRENNMHIFEDTLESFIGALFLDTKKDYGVCKTFIINLIEQEIDIPALLYNETNYKDTLLQHYHKMKWSDPEYGLLEVISHDTKKKFKMFTKGPDGKIVGTGIGSTKKKGEQEAAKNALIKFNVVKVDESDEDSDVYSDIGE